MTAADRKMERAIVAEVVRGYCRRTKKILRRRWVAMRKDLEQERRQRP